MLCSSINKRNRSGSNDTEQTNIAANVSPNKKHKSDKKSNSLNENKETGNDNKGQNQSKLGQKPRNTEMIKMLNMQLIRTLF